MKATRHNGKSGKHGTYDAKHNDRRFDVENSEHIDASYGKTGQLLRVSGAAVPFRTVRSTAMLARSATGEVNTVIYLYPAC